MGFFISRLAVPCSHMVEILTALRLQNLVGLELHDEYSQLKRIFVKDLPLYPLPIVRDDLPLYDLLNVFQLGMAR